LGGAPREWAKLAIYDGAGRDSRRRDARAADGEGEADGMDISDWRRRIDELDEQIVALISRRAEAAKAIGELKRQSALPVYELADAEMQHVYERIIDVMRTLQRRDA
jgi:chorismate mutase